MNVFDLMVDTTQKTDETKSIEQQREQFSIGNLMPIIVMDPRISYHLQQIQDIMNEYTCTSDGQRFLVPDKIMMNSEEHTSSNALQSMSRVNFVFDTNHSKKRKTISQTLLDAKYIDIQGFLNMPQIEAAKRLNMTSSTFCKRWNEATRGRPWPYRRIQKLQSLLNTLQQNPNKEGIAEEIQHIEELIHDELRSVKIRV